MKKSLKNQKQTKSKKGFREPLGRKPLRTCRCP